MLTQWKYLITREWKFFQQFFWCLKVVNLKIFIKICPWTMFEEFWILFTNCWNSFVIEGSKTANKTSIKTSKMFTRRIDWPMFVHNLGNWNLIFQHASKELLSNHKICLILVPSENNLKVLKSTKRQHSARHTKKHNRCRFSFVIVTKNPKKRIFHCFTSGLILFKNAASVFALNYSQQTLSQCETFSVCSVVFCLFHFPTPKLVRVETYFQALNKWNKLY